MSELGLPANIELERLLLGIAITHGREIFAIISEICQETHFSAHAHKLIWSALREIFESGATPERVLLIHQLQRKSGALEAVGGMAYVVDLNTGLPIMANPQDYAERVRNIGDRRTMAETMYRQYERLCSADASTADMRHSAEIIRALGVGYESTGLTRAGELMADINGFFADEFSAAGVVRPPSLWQRTRCTIDGFRPGELILLAARPGVGKSIASAMWAYDAATNQAVPTAVFSLEMKSRAILKRMIAAHGEVPLRSIRRGRMSPIERESALSIVNTASEIPLYLSDAQTYTVSGMYSAIQQLAAKQQVGFVIIDYLQLIKGNGRSRTEEVGSISRDLKRMANDLGVVVLALSQLSRAGDKEGRAPMLSDLRDSGTLEQDADMVIFLHPHRGKDDPDARMFVIAKQRDGISGRAIDMRLRGDQVRLDEER